MLRVRDDDASAFAELMQRYEGRLVRLMHMKTSILLFRMPSLPMVAARLRGVDGDLPRVKGWQLSAARCVWSAVGPGRADPQQGKAASGG